MLYVRRHQAEALLDKFRLQKSSWPCLQVALALFRSDVHVIQALLVWKARLVCNLVVVLGSLIADASTPRMKHRPYLESCDFSGRIHCFEAMLTFRICLALKDTKHITVTHALEGHLLDKMRIGLSSKDLIYLSTFIIDHLQDVFKSEFVI